MTRTCGKNATKVYRIKQSSATQLENLKKKAQRKDKRDNLKGLGAGFFCRILATEEA
jgi:hypothetical protein